MEIRHIRYSIQVYHDRNITKASKALFISQQALSKAIVNLEEEVGCPLFERSVSGLTPTDYADELYEHFNDTLCSFDRLTGAIQDVREKRMLRIIAPRGFSLTCTQENFSEYSRMNPESNVTYVEEDNAKIARALMERQADLGFIMVADQSELPPQMEICCESMDEATCCVVMHKTNPLSEKKIVTVQDLEEQSLLFLDSFHQLNSHIEQKLERETVSIKNIGEASLESFFTQLNVGFYIGFCNVELLTYFHFPDLICVPFSFNGLEVQKLKVYLVAWEKRMKTKEMRHYINYFQKKNETEND